MPNTRFSTKGPTPATSLGFTGTEGFLESLSAGERRWVDEAFATIARSLKRFGDQAAWQADFFKRLSEDDVMHQVMMIAHELDAAIEQHGFWLAETFDRLLGVLEAPLTAIARSDLENQTQINREASLHLMPGLVQLEPELAVRVFDEPEAHLHPAAQRALGRALDSLRLRGQNIVIASHSPQFLDLPGWKQIHVVREEGQSTVQVLWEKDSGARSILARQLGINRGELLAGVDALLIVEGLHDELVLRSIFGEELRASRVAVFRMHGTNNLPAIAELDFIDRYLDVPIAVLLDYVRGEGIRKGGPTAEEKALSELRKSCRRRKRTYHFHGLERPDIVAYLSESAIRTVYPDFAGWAPVLRAFKELRDRPSFKPWLQEKWGIDLTTSRSIERILSVMSDQGHRPAGELTRTVNEVLADFGNRG